MISKITPQLNLYTSQKNKNNSASLAFKGGVSSRVSDWFYNSNSSKWILEKAADKQLIFDAAFALLLTCILRPASIMVLPSKKNKDDQKYASAHSIASGVIGFAISNIIFTPISNAIKKMKEAPAKYIKGPHLLEIDKGKQVVKKIPKTYLDRLPDVVGSIPKGILTIALIPPILKYVFHMEKKKSSEQKQEIQQPPIYYGTMNFKSSNSKNRTVFENLGGVR